MTKKKIKPSMPAGPEAGANNLDESVVPHKPGMEDRFVPIEPVEEVAEVTEPSEEPEAEAPEPAEEPTEPGEPAENEPTE